MAMQTSKVMELARKAKAKVRERKIGGCWGYTTRQPSLDMGGRFSREAGDNRQASKASVDPFLSLPAELHDLILSFITYFPKTQECVTCRYRTLSAMSKVNRGWYRAMVHYLYEIVWISQRDPHWDDRRCLGHEWRRDCRRFTLKEEWRVTQLVRTLEERKDLAQLVKVLKLPGLSENGLALLLWARAVAVCENVEYIYGPEFTSYRVSANFMELLNCRDHAQLRFLAAIGNCRNLREFVVEQGLVRVQPGVFHSAYRKWNNMQEITITLDKTLLVESLKVRLDDFLTMFDKLKNTLKRLMLANVPAALLDDRIFKVLLPLERFGAVRCRGITFGGLKGFLERGYDFASQLKVLLLEEIDMTEKTSQLACEKLCEVVKAANGLRALNYRTGRRINALPPKIPLLESNSLQHIDLRFTPFRSNFEDIRPISEHEIDCFQDYLYLYRSVENGSLPSLISITIRKILFLQEKIFDGNGCSYLKPCPTHGDSGVESYVLSVHNPLYRPYPYSDEGPYTMAHLRKSGLKLPISPHVLLMHWDNGLVVRDDLCNGIGRRDTSWYTQAICQGVVSQPGSLPLKRRMWVRWKEWRSSLKEMGECLAKVVEGNGNAHAARYYDGRMLDLVEEWRELEVIPEKGSPE